MVRKGFHDDNVRAWRDDLARAEQRKSAAERRGANSTELTSIADTIRLTRDSLTNAERARDQANNGKWKPGTVAEVSVRGTTVRAIRGEDIWWTGIGGFVDDNDASDVRPLVVIDAPINVDALIDNVFEAVAGTGGTVAAVVRATLAELDIEPKR